MIYTDVQKAKQQTEQVVNRSQKQTSKMKRVLSQFEQSLEELTELLQQRSSSNASESSHSSMDNK